MEMALPNTVSKEDVKEEPKETGGKVQQESQCKGGFGPKGKIKKLDMHCRKCCKKGHFVKECRTKDSNVKCYNCNQFGYMKWECPAPQKTSTKVVPSYALDMVASSSMPPVADNGKKVIIEGMLTLFGFPIELYLI